MLRYSSESTIESFDDDEDEETNFEEEVSDNEARHTHSPKNFANNVDNMDDNDHKNTEEEDEEGWGSSKQDYYDADKLVTEQDALDEEAEALRLQKKQLKGFDAADFGFDESEWQDKGSQNGSGGDEEGYGVLTETLSQKPITEDMEPNERLEALYQRYPEFEPLSKEMVILQKEYEEITSRMPQLRKVKLDQNTSPRFPAAIKCHTLAAYLASLTMYFAILTSPNNLGENETKLVAPADLRIHAIMDSLYRCRSLWERVKDISVEVLEPVENYSDNIMAGLSTEKPKIVEHILLPKPERKDKQDGKEKFRRQHHQRVMHKKTEGFVAEKRRKLEKDLENLDSLTSITEGRNNFTAVSKPSTSDLVEFSASDLGEDTEITAYEMAEKARKRKRLRFYTSQIAQKANKRETAGKNAGGDMDIPYRERLRDRSARLTAEASKRARSKVKDEADLGEQSDDEIAMEIADGVRDDTMNENYYDMIASRTAQRKRERSDKRAAFAEAARVDGRVAEVEEVRPDGKRAITYAIEKNKGLTPRRKKEVRNPRVKKRMKFEDKKKKLGSIKPLYKGGEGKGGYKGELTGIKTDVVKSRKL